MGKATELATEAVESARDMFNRLGDRITARRGGLHGAKDLRADVSDLARLTVERTILADHIAELEEKKRIAEEEDYKIEAAQALEDS